MGKVKDLNIKNWTYYYFDDIIDRKKFVPNLLKIDKKSYKYFNIYYIGYNMIKALSNCECDYDYENVRSVNLLYLIIHSATGYFKEEYGKEYLILNSNKKYEEVLTEIKSEIKTINGGKELFYDNDYAKISVNSDDDVPLNEILKFPTLIIIIRCVFQKSEELDPLIYLDECLYESV